MQKKLVNCFWTQTSILYLLQTKGSGQYVSIVWAYPNKPSAGLLRLTWENEVALNKVK